MGTRTKRKILIVGSVLTMVGATAGVLTAVTGERGTARHPTAWQPTSGARAQNVDLDNPPSLKVHVAVYNIGWFVANACVDNTTEARACTGDVTWTDQPKKIETSLKPGELGVKIHGYAHAGPDSILDLPKPDKPLWICVQFDGDIIGNYSFKTMNCPTGSYAPGPIAE